MYSKFRQILAVGPLLGALGRGRRRGGRGRWPRRVRRSLGAGFSRRVFPNIGAGLFRRLLADTDAGLFCVGCGLGAAEIAAQLEAAAARALAAFARAALFAIGTFPFRTALAGTVLALARAF